MNEEEEFEFQLQMEREQAENPMQFEVVLGAKPKPPEPSAPSAGNFYGSGFLRGLKDPVDAGAQLLPRGVEFVTSAGGLLPNPVSRWAGEQATGVDELVRGDEKAYGIERLAQAYEDDGETDAGFDWARLAGNVVNPATIAGGTAVAGTIPRVLGATGKETMKRTLARGALTGGALGAAQPVIEGDNFAGEKAQQIGIGSLFGAGGDLLGRGLARTLKPETDEAAKLLLREGVRVTPGGILGGTAKRAEDAATSIPLMGDSILSAQQRAYNDLNRAVANRALGPIGQKLPDDVPAGYELVQHVEDALSGAYNAMLPKLQFKPDPRFATEFKTIKQMTDLLPDQQVKQFEKIVRDKLINHMTPQGNMNGESFKAAESSLKAAARGYRSSPDYDQRKLGEAFDALLDSMRQNLERANPAHAKELRKINEGWANFTRLRKAASYTAADDGVFTPAMLHRAVREKSGGVDKSQFAKGKALMQDLSGAAKSTLPSKVPDSGTARRALLGGGALASGGLSPGIPAALLTGAAAYTRPGQYVLRTALAGERPAFADPLAELVRKYGYGVGAGLSPAIESGR